mmetsp:Transcript_26809/g.67493  ORF Transcript_26809/g.67493 Transcript_26809/m.67493 type:complete len:284 (-) Transcript_26809:184-1035(-)
MATLQPVEGCASGLHAASPGALGGSVISPSSPVDASRFMPVLRALERSTLASCCLALRLRLATSCNTAALIVAPQQGAATITLLSTSGSSFGPLYAPWRSFPCTVSAAAAAPLLRPLRFPLLHSVPTSHCALCARSGTSEGDAALTMVRCSKVAATAATSLEMRGSTRVVGTAPLGALSLRSAAIRVPRFAPQQGRARFTNSVRNFCSSASTSPVVIPSARTLSWYNFARSSGTLSSSLAVTERTKPRAESAELRQTCTSRGHFREMGRSAGKVPPGPTKCEA